MEGEPEIANSLLVRKPLLNFSVSFRALSLSLSLSLWSFAHAEPCLQSFPPFMFLFVASDVFLGFACHMGKAEWEYFVDITGLHRAPLAAQSTSKCPTTSMA